VTVDPLDPVIWSVPEGTGGVLLCVFSVTCSVFFSLQNWGSVFGGRTSAAMHNGGPLH
jgi:hypothetical protein